MVSYYANLSEKCQNGDAEAINEYENTHFLDDKIDIDIEEIKNMADENNSYAINLLGFMHQNGKYVDQDDNKAISFYEKAISLDNPSAMNNMAYMYQYGRGVKKDYQVAISLYERAVEMNCSSAMNNLACIYFCGEIGVDYEKAISLLEKASRLNNLSSHGNLAHFYRRGIVVKKDVYRALDLYIMSRCKEGCLILMDEIINGDSFDIEKMAKIFGDPYIITIYVDMPDCVKNIKSTIDFYNKEIMKTVLLTKNIPGDMIGEILRKI